MKIKYSSLSETGFKRQENQDSVLSVYNGEVGLFVVADGMGGHSDGAYASQKIISELQALWDEIRHGNLTLEQLTEQVLTALNKVNSELFAYSESNSIICGSTVSVLLICGKEYAAINAGDSPVFMANRHTARHITVEHSYGEMVRKSGGEEKNIPLHRRNRLTKAIGIESRIYPDVFSSIMDERSVFLLCSDGVSRYYPDRKMFRILKSVVQGKYSSEEMLEHIKNHVEKSGAADNFSEIIIDCSEVTPEADAIFSTQKILRAVIGFAIVTAIICAVIFAVQLLK